MLRRVLEEQGYETRLIGDSDADGTYRGINSAEFGDIEKRVRMALLAFPKGMSLDVLPLAKTGPSARTVGEVRLPEVEIDPAEYEKGLCLDGERKRSKGWRNRVVEDSARITPSLSSACYKQRPEDPKFRHPTDPSKSRLPDPIEHARLKGHSDSIINSLTHNSLAHTALGNGAVKGCWVAVGRSLGAWLRQQRSGLEAYVQALQSVKQSSGQMSFLDLGIDAA